MQGTRNATEYALEFCTLTEGGGLNEPVLKSSFHQGLNPEVLIEKACQNDKVSHDSLIDLIIHQD